MAQSRAKEGYEEGRAKIKAGNVPPHVKVSQVHQDSIIGGEEGRWRDLFLTDKHGMLKKEWNICVRHPWTEECKAKTNRFFI